MAGAEIPSQDGNEPSHLTSSDHTEEAGLQADSFPAQAVVSRSAAISPVVVPISEKLGGALERFGGDLIIRDYDSLTFIKHMEDLFVRLGSADDGSHNGPTQRQLAHLEQLSLALCRKRNLGALRGHIAAWRRDPPSQQKLMLERSDRIAALQSDALDTMFSASYLIRTDLQYWAPTVQACVALVQFYGGQAKARATFASDSERALRLKASASEARASIGQSINRAGETNDIFCLWLAEEIAAQGITITKAEVKELSCDYHSDMQAGHNIRMLVGLFGWGVVPWLISIHGLLPNLANINPAHMCAWCRIVHESIEKLATLYQPLGAGTVERLFLGLNITPATSAPEHDIPSLSLQEILATAPWQIGETSEHERSLDIPEDHHSFDAEDSDSGDEIVFNEQR